MTRDPLPWRPLRSGKISEEVSAVTFDEWWAGHPHEARYLTHAGLARRCWEAAIASHQAETQQLLDRLAGGMKLAHKTQLARYDTVVKAARDILEESGFTDAGTGGDFADGPEDFPRSYTELRDALAALNDSAELHSSLIDFESSPDKIIRKVTKR